MAVGRRRPHTSFIPTALGPGWPFLPRRLAGFIGVDLWASSPGAGRSPPFDVQSTRQSRKCAIPFVGDCTQHKIRRLDFLAMKLLPGDQLQIVLTVGGVPYAKTRKLDDAWSDSLLDVPELSLDLAHALIYDISMYGDEHEKDEQV